VPWISYIQSTYSSSIILKPFKFHHPGQDLSCTHCSNRFQSSQLNLRGGSVPALNQVWQAKRLQRHPQSYMWLFSEQLKHSNFWLFSEDFKAITKSGWSVPSYERSQKSFYIKQLISYWWGLHRLLKVLGARNPYQASSPILLFEETWMKCQEEYLRK
jgi:hypothetical protein